MIEHLRTLPDDWDSWLVHADQLIQRGDECGEWLVREHRGERAEVGRQADDRIVRCAEWLGHEILGTWWWLRKLEPLGDPPTPPDLRQVFAQPISQLAAFINWDGTDEPIPPAIALHRDRVFAATLAWIDRAFHAPVPGLGRWQELSESNLLGLDERVEELDPQGFLYYAPAVMSLALRRRQAGESLMEFSWFISGTLSLTLYPPQYDDYHLELQRQLFKATLDREQRGALFANALVLDKEPSGQVAWRRVWDSEREKPRRDWFSLFEGKVTNKKPSRPVKKSPEKGAAKKAAAMKPAKTTATKRPAGKKKPSKNH